MEIRVKKPLYILIGVTIIAMLISSVFGAWTLLNYSGSWDNVENVDNLSYQGWNPDPAYANYTYGNIGNLADGQGFQINFKFTVIGDRKEWWWIEGTKRFYFALGLHGTNGVGWSLFYVGHEQGVIMKTSEAIIGTQTRINVGKPFLQIGETVDTIDAEWTMQFIRIDANTLKVIYATHSPLAQVEFQSGTMVWNETLTVDSSIWTNPELRLYVGHDGSGTFNVSFTDTYVGTITELQKTLPEGLEPAPWQWITDGFNFIMSLVMIAGQTLGAFLPVLPFLFLFYIIDVAITSAQQGSFTPIGNFLMTIWDILQKGWDVLVRFGQLLWDIITFWT